MGQILEFKDAPQSKEPGVRTRFTLVNEDLGAKRVAVMLSEYEPQAIHESHYHYHENRETIYIALEGSGTLKLNGIEYQFKPNTVAFIAPGDKHALIRVGEEGFKMLEINSLPSSRSDTFIVQE